ncbi:MAG: transposase [Candidatus Paceibacterota bacterium]
MRKQPIITGENYHIYNRGVDKRDIFGDKFDLRRFVESIKEFNQVDTIGSLINLRKTKKIQKGPKALSEESLVSIVVYCLNPNHFHFILKQSTDGGIAKFMQKLQSGYTSYFNIKNKRSGSLFQGTFKAQHIGSENYFNKTLGYVNKNYQVHDIPEDKKELVFASDYEYENNNFKIVSKVEGKRILEIFGGAGRFKKHSDEIVEIIRKERGKTLLSEDENLPERA